MPWRTRTQASGARRSIMCKTRSTACAPRRTARRPARRRSTLAAAVKALLGFAHKVGYTRFNAAPLIKLKKVPRQLAKRILPVVDVHLIIRAAKPGREEVICEVAYYGTCASPRLPR